MIFFHISSIYIIHLCITFSAIITRFCMCNWVYWASCNTNWHFKLMCTLGLCAIQSGTHKLKHLSLYSVPVHFILQNETLMVSLYCRLSLHLQSICIAIYLSIYYGFCFSMSFIMVCVFQLFVLLLLLYFLFFFFSYREMLYCLTLFLCYWDYRWKLTSRYNPAFLQDLTCSSMCTVPFK